MNSSKSTAGYSLVSGLATFVVILALAAFCYSLHNTKQAQQKEIARLQAQVKELEPLRAAAKEMTNLRAQAREAQSLRKDTEELARLRNEVGQLKREKQQAANVATENQELRGTLQQVQQAYADQARAQQNQIAQFQAAQVADQNNKIKYACIANLKQIDGATQQWALENRFSSKTFVDLNKARAYLKGGQLPICPGGGAYSATTVEAAPRCTIPGHTL
jgi:hypothetical protein